MIFLEDIKNQFIVHNTNSTYFRFSVSLEVQNGVRHFARKIAHFRSMKKIAVKEIILNICVNMYGDILLLM